MSDKDRLFEELGGLNQEELFKKNRIGEKVFKRFLQIGKYLQPKPFDGIELKDCRFELKYTFISVLKEISVYQYGDYNAEIPVILMEYWIRVYYRAERDDWFESSIDLFIDSKDCRSRVNKPQKRQFYLRLHPDGYKAIANVVAAHIKVCKIEMGASDENQQKCFE